MSSSALSSGAGVCSPDFRLALTFHREVLDLGAAPDLFRAAFGAIHRVNRHGPDNKRVGVALPQARAGAGIRGIQQLGEVFMSFGSRDALERVLEDEALTRLQRRGMFSSRIRPVDFDGGLGCFLSRDRQGEKDTPAFAARRARRDLIRADHISDTRGRVTEARNSTVPDGDRGFITLKAGRKVAFRFGTAPYISGPLSVSTYGLSSASSPSIFPICADSFA